MYNCMRVYPIPRRFS